jgi:5'-deoxynucleotidase YfbR-like HD superfamily hydrolase
MGDREDRMRSVLMTYFPMFIAVLSLVTAIYNGYLNGKFVDIIQRNLGRAEHMRTCKEIIDAYFQVKFRTGLVNASASRERAGGAPGAAAEHVEAANAVNKFAALGTYLANLRDDATRERYTNLSRQLEKIVNESRNTPSTEFNKLFEPADRMFTDMNDDCVNTAKAAPM